MARRHRNTTVGTETVAADNTGNAAAETETADSKRTVLDVAEDIIKSLANVRGDEIIRHSELHEQGQLFLRHPEVDKWFNELSMEVLASVNGRRVSERTLIGGIVQAILASIAADTPVPFCFHGNHLILLPYRNGQIALFPSAWANSEKVVEDVDGRPTDGRRINAMGPKGLMTNILLRDITYVRSYAQVAFKGTRGRNPHDFSLVYLLRQAAKALSQNIEPERLAFLHEAVEVSRGELRRSVAYRNLRNACRPTEALTKEETETETETLEAPPRVF